MMDHEAKTRRFPPWIRKRLPAGGRGQFVRDLLRDLNLSTVCQSAHCPNAGECFAAGTATFMILGDHCTRNCTFCAIAHEALLPVDPDEPARVAEAVARMELRYVVVTSVTRDDLPDGGAEQFKRVIVALRERTAADVEVLTPDFQGNWGAVDTVTEAKPTVYNHNLETVERLYPRVRPQADYRRSLELLAHVARTAPDVATKSGLMVGVGEKREEVLDTLRDLRQVTCDIVTIGQYLRPSEGHLAVERFVTPAEFMGYERIGREMGFQAVVAGPFVRSSYHAGSVYRTGGIAHEP